MRMRALLSEFESDIKRRACEYDMECPLEDMDELEYECFWDAYLNTNVPL